MSFNKPKPRSAVAVNRDRDVAVAVAVAVGSDDRDQFFALTTATDFVLSPHAYVHNVEQYFYILITGELLVLAPGLSFLHISTSLRFCERRLDVIILEYMLTKNTVHLIKLE